MKINRLTIINDHNYYRLKQQIKIENQTKHMVKKEQKKIDAQL